MNDEDVFVRIVDLPGSCRGFSRCNPDGSYTVILNARISSEQQRITYKHETGHVSDDDFGHGRQIDDIEAGRREKDDRHDN